MTTGEYIRPLDTKIVVPRCVPGLIQRPRLLSLTTQVQTKQLTVIKAGAGFGKTSLAVTWAQLLQPSGGLVAWLSLEADDDEPTRFFFYVAHALQRASNQIGEAAVNLILDISLVPVTTIISSLINELADLEDEVYLFLDDYHWITNVEIHTALSFFLKYAPTRFHLVLTTRIEPALPLARLRSQNRLLEIDASVMRFDLDETRAFLVHENLDTLDISQLHLLHTKTEGWPAVLRIVAVTASQSPREFGQYVQRLSGTSRPISAYLDELLDDVPDDIVQFMLRTAILDRFCVPLCQAVTGAESSRALLASIEARQLLLVPLDLEGCWYRYHALLVDHLVQMLEARFAGEIPDLHRRASQWYAKDELWTDAVQHAIAAGDTDQAVAWIENCAMALVKRGDLLTLLGWQRRFPSELMRSRITARLAIAWGMALAMRFQDSLRLVAEAEQNIGSDGRCDVQSLKCECQAIRSVAIALKDDTSAALSLAETCLSTATDAWTANVASNVVRLGRWKSGDLAGFYATAWLPFASDEERRNVFASVYRLSLQGLVEFQQLRVGVAERYYLEAMRQAVEHVGPHSVAAALPASLIARIRYEQGRFEEAESMVIDRISIINATGMLECALSAYLVMVRIAVYRMNIERAYSLLDQAETLGHTRQWGRLVAAVLVERLRLYLTEGRIAEGDACLARLDQLAVEYPTPTDCAWSEIHRYGALAQAYVAMAQSRFPDALTILRDLRREVETAHNHYLALCLGIQISLALLGANETSEAVSMFRGVLSAAEPAGIQQMILDQGMETGTLLLRAQDDAQRTGQSRDSLRYLGTLITRWRALYQPEPTKGSAAALTASLSPRERSILELIGQGESNKDIARSLGITPETVKSHVKNIFIKLAVEKRAQAVSRAQGLGLLRTG